MIMRFTSNIQHQALNRPISSFGGEVCGALGLAGGLTYGINKSLGQTHGWVWRPAMYSTLGMSGGFIIGLYWQYVLTACIAVDATLSICGVKYHQVKAAVN